MRAVNQQQLLPSIVILVCLWPWGVRAAASVVINEFMASNHHSLEDGYGQNPDWIELYNDGTRSDTLEGWFLTDDRHDLTKWAFPAGVSLGPQSYLVVFASGKDEPSGLDPKGYLHTNFALKKEGEYLALVSPDGQVSQAFSPAFPSQQTDISYGLWQGRGVRYFGTPTPGAANKTPWVGLTSPPAYDHQHGFYNAPFNLVLTCDTPGAVIHYTVDGSEPDEQHGTIYDPCSPIPITSTLQIRALAYKPDWMPSAVMTQTYLFVQDVAEQPNDPPGWPSDWGTDAEVGGTVPADYAMDPRVVNNTLPGYSVPEALLAIPSMSISMDLNDFIGKTRGICTHPQSHWERQCSIEYILPDGGRGFQADCKIEIHGGSSRRPWRMQKHSFRLTFTSQYGPARLQYPLFPESDVTSFNKLVLRACFTDSWGLVSWMPSRYRPNDSQYTRDVWMKESLRDMGQPSSTGTYVQLYVDGLYFGLYNLTERIDEDFCADHLGGNPNDWEMNKDFSTPGPHWKEMMSIDPSTPAGYARIQQYLDVNDFADYMLLHFYADAEDWPSHNGYAAANVVSGDGKFRFFVWDQEIALDYHGRAASRINQSAGVGALFQKMRTSPEFLQLFADRVYQQCFNHGALSVAASQDRYARVAGWIDKAIVAESARWGDTQMSTPYGNTIDQPHPLDNINDNAYPPAPHGPNYYFTREDSWVVERDNIINNYIPAILDPSNSFALINVLRKNHLYPAIDPPVFLVNGHEQVGGVVHPGDQLSLFTPESNSFVMYTLDGTDIRLSQGGQAASSILIYDSPIMLTKETQIKARVWAHGILSALSEAVFDVIPAQF